MWSPREATSVATSMPIPCLCRMLMALILLLCDSPPCIGIAFIFCARRFFAILSQFLRVAQKTIPIPGVSFFRKCTSSENFSCGCTAYAFSVRRLLSTWVSACTGIGEFMYLFMSERSLGENVAPKSSVWRCFGVHLMIFSTSLINPMSSILSASSSTRYWTVFSLYPRCIMSRSLPGVATTTSAVRRALICAPMPTPPYIGVIFAGRCFANPLSASLTCTQSSLVGVRISA